MHVQVDEARHHEHVAQIDHRGVRRQTECAGSTKPGRISLTLPSTTATVAFVTGSRRERRAAARHE